MGLMHDEVGVGIRDRSCPNGVEREEVVGLDLVQVVGEHGGQQTDLWEVRHTVSEGTT
jgi:hypothetical protein